MTADSNKRLRVDQPTLVLGIDSSTQSCSGIILDTASGKLVTEASVNYGADLPQYAAPNGFIPGGADGEVHTDPCMLLDALELLFEQLSKKCDLAQVVAISGAGQQHGSVYLGKAWFDKLAALSPEASLASQIKPCLTRSTAPIWMDTSTSEECREIAAAAGGNENVCKKSGSIVVERFTGPQIRRFFKKEGEAYDSTDRIHLISSFLCSILAGKDAPIDTGDGAGMNLLNLKTQQWDDELMNATAPKLQGKLPAVVAGNSVVGQVSNYFVSKYGFPKCAKIIVFTGDNPSSLVGMGASSPGKVVISLGTSDTFFAAMEESRTDPAGFGHVFGNPSGGCMTLQCFLNGSLAREKVKDRFDLSWEGFSKSLLDTPVGNSGNLMVPFFGPEISPRVELKNGPLLQGSDEFVKWEDTAASVRACVEGQFLNMKARTAWMRLETEVVYLTGGASQNNEVAKIIADIFQAKVKRLSLTGGCGVGAAIRAASNGLGIDLAVLEQQFCQPEAGEILPDPKAGELYAKMLADLDTLAATAA